MSRSLSHSVWREAVCQFKLARVHMCMNVNVLSEEMDVFQDTELFSHQTAYPGGTQHFLSGTQLNSPPGKTDHPVQCVASEAASASKGQMDKEK